MFDNGRFDYLKFGLRAEDTRDFDVAVNFSDSLKNLSGSGSAIFVDLFVFESMQNTAKLTPTFPEKFTALGELKADIDVIGGLIVLFDSSTDLNNKTSIIKNIEAFHNYLCEFKNKVYVGKDFAIYGNDSNFKSVLDVILSFAKDIKTAEVLTELLNSIISTVILDTESCEILVTIPANGTLEIHTDTYDVFLDGVNIIHLHNGDWIFLDRDVISVDIDTGTGGQLQGQLLYDERYL